MKLSKALQIMKEFSLPSDLPKIKFGERRRYLIEATTDFEILLMLWGAEAETPIHDHSGSRCWMRLLRGKLTETTFRGELPEEIETNVFRQDVNLFIEDQLGFHRLTNPDNIPAISLHLYAKPLRVSRYFDEEDGLWKRCKLTIDGDFRDKI